MKSSDGTSPKTAIDYMRLIGKIGIPIMLRYDPYRQKNHFTIVIGDRRLRDTDDPISELEAWMEEA